MKEFVNFHAHSTSSLLDGMSKFDEYAARAKQLNQPGICFTEHGNLHSLLNAYEAAKSEGVKYFPGIEFYQARKTRFDRDEEEKSGKASEEWQQRGPYHLGVIAYNNVGYHNLLHLSSKAYLEGWYGKPRIDRELLAQHAEGLVGLSGCLSGEIQQALARGDNDFALHAAADFRDIFGKDNFFIEMQDHGIQQETDNRAGLLWIADQLNTPIIATCDCHYTYAEHKHAHDILLCTNTGARIDTPDRFSFTGDYHLKSYEEMARLFPEEWLDNTLLITEKHDVNLAFNEYHLPKFPTPSGQSSDEYFLESVQGGATIRFGSDWRQNQQIRERIDYEVDVIREMGFPDYFLIVSDIVKYAKDNNILVGAGRGSAAGSLVGYCLDITEVDPLEYGLPFERFLIRGRKSMPDIDLDFDDRYRDQVIQYTREKYGYDHTANICTVSEIGAKTAIKDVARVLNYPYEVGDRINKSMPPALFGVTKTLDECLETEEFRQLYETDIDVKKILDTAKIFEGLWRQTGVHAAGLVVADKPVMEYVPLMKKGADKPIITQWEMKQIDKCGLLKVDFLGLRNLSIISMCIENIEKTKGIKIGDPYKLIKDNDPKVYQALTQGDNIGVFQMEGGGMRNLMTHLKPDSFLDLAAILALYRPGPMGSGVHVEYAERKNGRKPITYLHKALEPYLKDTFGLLLYQEQLLQIAINVAGFPVIDSDSLRKAVGKKLPEEMKKWRERFVDGCVETSNMPVDIATKLWNDIEHHASYSFSLCHAVAYAFTSYITAYLRIYYPTEFMAAALTSIKTSSTTQDRLRLYLSECKKMGIKVLPPSINESDPAFAVINDDTVRYGFESVKGVGDRLTAILKRDAGGYKNLWDFMRKADTAYLDRGVVDGFIDAGCYDEFLESMDIPQDSLTRREKLQVLHRELLSLGVFLTHHPFTDAADLIQGKTTHTIRQLQDVAGGSRVKVAGMVLECTQKITRQGKKMYNMQIEDTELNMQVDIMPAVAAKLPDKPFSVGDIVIITGKVKKEGEDENPVTSLFFYEAEKVSEVDLTGVSPIVLKTNRFISYEKIDKINAIIESTKGNVPVYLVFNDGEGEIKVRFASTTSREKEKTLLTLLEV